MTWSIKLGSHMSPMMDESLSAVIQGENLQRILPKSDHRQRSSPMLATYENQATVFLGFTGTFFSNSEWGSTQYVLMIVLHWSKQISRNCTHLLPNTRSTHTVKIFFTLMTVYRFGVDPSEIYDVT